MSRRFISILLLTLVLMFCVSGLQAQDKVLSVTPDGEYSTIDAALAAAETGDRIEVHSGIYAAPLVVEKSVTLRGVGQPVIDGQGSGSIVIIAAPDVHFEGFTVRNSGTNLNHEDTGIVVQAPRVTVANNIVEEVLFGIYFANANDSIAQQNTVHCLNRDLGLRGDGVRVWYSNKVTISKNNVVGCRDTLVWYAQDITIVDNAVLNSRYGLHFMYSSHAVVENNTFEHNSVGTYLMYSQHLSMNSNRMIGNRGPSGYGIALKDMDHVTLQDNLLLNNRAGLYIDNSPALVDINNTIFGNFFGYNDIAIAALPSTARNVFQANTFLENNQQVSVQGRGNLLGNTWSQDGLGNYWSDYVGYDGDADGLGDVPYRAEKLFESLADSQPVLRLFLYSPASQAIDFAASAFPSLRPDPKLIDEAPMMHFSRLAAEAETAPQVSLPLLVAALLLLTLGAGITGLALWSPGRHRKQAYRGTTLQAGV